VTRLISAFLAAACVTALCGFAVPASAASPVSTLPAGSDASTWNDRAQIALLDAEVAAQRGDWSGSATLAEQSYREKPDLWNEFNLATAYQHTRREALAIPLYLDLVVRGQYARTYPLYSYDRSWPTPMLPFIADEAAHRLDQMGVHDYPAVAAR
jgi:hypothetical protein